jgi:hypothetical protein
MNSELLQKHIEFEMNLVSKSNLSHTIRQEITILVDSFGSKSLSQVLPPEKLEKLALYYLREFELSSEILDALKKSIEEGVHLLAKDKGNLSSYIDKDSFFELLRSLIGFKEVRNRMIHFAVHSSSYSRMLSNIIYAAIKDFLVTENPLAKNPIGGSFFKFGQDILNNLPGMEGNFDKKITEFISKNLSGRIQESEAHIKNELDSGKTEEVFQELWEAMQKVPLSDSEQFILAGDLDTVFKTFPGFWKYLKKSEFLERQVSTGIKEFYKENADRSLEDMGKLLGLEKGKIIDELTHSSLEFLDNDEFRDVYKEFLTRRLGAFYASL